MNSPRIEPGSFRDRNGRVFYLGDEVYRGLSAAAWEDWCALSRSRFFERATAQGKIIRTVEAEIPVGELKGLREEWVGALRHDRIPFVSYPYEWSFSMLRDAALLQLELVNDALLEDMTLKDCSAFNVQWSGSRAVFVDISSFQRRTKKEPWIGYLQFCQLFLFPLFLSAYKGIDFRPWLRGSIDGITPENCRRVMSVRDLLRPGVMSHVYLQARMQRGAQDSSHSVRRDLSKVGFERELILTNIRRLTKLVRGLEWWPSPSGWLSYADDNSYSEEERQQKEDFVRRAAESRRWRLAWDLGCNTGVFSRIVSEHAKYTVAMDADAQVVDEFYRELHAEADDRILPLVVNLADPSPAVGWRSRERQALSERQSPDLILGLALLHHLVIGSNIPLEDVVEWLASFGAHLIVEFVAKEDVMAQRLLLNKDLSLDDYERIRFEGQLAMYFDVIERLELPSRTRTIYFARPRG